MKLIKLSLLLLVGILAVSCTWGSRVDETREQVLTLAYKSSDADFSAFKTYAITDSITVINNGTKTRVKDSQTEMILAQIEKCMNGCGYTLVATTNTPNLLVDVSYIQLTNTSVYPGSWNDWGWWWDSYFYPWHSWNTYYPYHMPNVVSSYTTGSIIIDIADVTNVAKDSTVPIVWHGLVRSILDYNHTQAQILAAINEVFTILPPQAN